ncbi:MAG: HD-GYP domain-containing protein [Spirochaetales bacterium]|nr:HD-GYP domain-containing protein [Spirochaetales bacterium]
MKEIPVVDLKAGMTFTKAVYIDDNNILVPPNIPLKQKDIDRLFRWEIFKVFTEGEVVDKSTQTITIEQEDVISNRKTFDVYISMIDRINEIFQMISNKVEIEQKKLNTKMDSIIRDILAQIDSNKGDLVQYMLVGRNNERKMAISAINCGILTAIIAQNLKLISFKMNQLITGALLHDVGMFSVDSAILNKTEKLSPEELNNIKIHPIFGYKTILNVLNYPKEVAVIALYHHEKWNGTGYPQGLKETKIPLYSRIVAVADSYDAMINKRPYRDPIIGYNVMKIILSDNGSHFDPDIVKIFIKSMGIYPIGSVVVLNNSYIGKVVGMNLNAPLRPKIELVLDNEGTKLPTRKNVDLLEDKDLFIVKAIDPGTIEGLND